MCLKSNLKNNINSIHKCCLDTLYYQDVVNKAIHVAYECAYNVMSYQHLVNEVCLKCN